MKAIRTVIAAASLAGLLAAGLAAPGVAQEISESHLAAARAAVTSARTAEGFDNVLPVIADQVQNSLIRQRPDLHAEISDAVNAVAINLAVRRADLDNDVARVWARAFTEEELATITAFYRSPAGQKLAEVGPKVLEETLGVLQGWGDRIGEELLEKSREELKNRGIEF
jgi:hypothetical protein